MTSLAVKVGRELTTEPLQMSFEGRLGLSPEEAFAFISDADQLVHWIPMAKKTYSDDSKADEPQGVGSVRVISTGFGPPTLETVKHKDAPHTYAYSAADKNLMGMYRNHLSVISVEPHPAGGSKVTWVAFCKRTPLSFLGKRMFEFVLGTGMKKLEKKFPA